MSSAYGDHCSGVIALMLHAYVRIHMYVFCSVCMCVCRALTRMFSQCSVFVPCRRDGKYEIMRCMMI